MTVLGIIGITLLATLGMRRAKNKADKVKEIINNEE